MKTFLKNLKFYFLVESTTTENQWTGFYMIMTSVMKEFIQPIMVKPNILLNAECLRIVIFKAAYKQNGQSSNGQSLWPFSDPLVRSIE